MGSRVSVVINTLNEEKNLPFALRSVQSWVDEIVVVDMYSDDKTVEIAREFGAKVFSHERVGFADPARAFALEQASGDWILLLDADEMVPLPLSRTLLSIACGGSADAVRIPRLNYMLGAPLMHTSCGPDQDTHFRFFKKHHVRTTSTVHNYLHVVPGSRALTLRFEPGLALVHFTYLDSQQFIERLNRYTSIEAQQAFERGERITPVGTLVKAAKHLVGRYIKGRGFQDGWRGLYISLFYSFYKIVTAAKLQELTALGPRERIESRYRQEAEEILHAYGGPQSLTAS
ncbi:MAG: glycosyltransferase family 2 protein [Terriglobia bacterium]